MSNASLTRIDESCGEQASNSTPFHQTMLSERAKGKLRAIEPIIDDDDQASSTHLSGQRDSSDPPKPASRDLVVRFTEGMPDLTVVVNKEDSVKDIKRRVSSVQMTTLFLSSRSFINIMTPDSGESPRAA